MAEKLARDRRLTERQGPWLVLAVLASLATAAVAVAIDLGVFDEFEGFSSVLRGYTLVGLLLGLSSTACCLLTFAYSVRKRPLQEYWPVGRSTLAAWLWSHVYFGLLSVVLALAHAGYGTLSFELSTGKVLLFVLVVLVGSGTLWRALYAVLPKRAAAEVGNYSFHTSQARAEESRVEIDKIAAGRSPAFRKLTDWLLSAAPAEHEIAHAAASLPPEEQKKLAEVAVLAKARRTALAREREQKRFLGSLSRSRILHVPLSVAFLVFLPLHVIGALELPAKMLPPGGAPGGATLGAFEPSETCRSCHRSIYDEWSQSMHAHSMTSPLMIAQTNAVVARVLSGASTPDPKEICVNCHGPVGAFLTTGATLPLAGSRLADQAFLNEGISCVVCHQYDGKPHPGGGGSFTFQADLERGRTYFGPHDDAVGNAFHKSEAGAIFRKPEQLCKNCHMVQVDKNGDGKYERGVDLVLQTLFDEWEFATKGSGPTCVDCHMPATGRRRSADGASVPFEQDRDAPDRAVRDHSFVAVDYPLDNGAARAASRPRREALLRGAATIGLVPQSIENGGGRVSFEVEVRNTGTSHNLPGGFAFVRQMWLEVTVQDSGGRTLASSGVLASSSDDLCDASIVDDLTSPVRRFLRGCDKSDPQLTNFQQMLVDKVEVARDPSGAILKGSRGENLLTRAPGAQEAIVQYLEGGPVPRLRPSTKQLVAPLAFGEGATFAYDFPTSSEARRLVVRLLFRTVPPYFLRALDQAEPSVGLVRYIESIEITEAARIERAL